MKRLRAKAPRVKHKALLVIKNCIEKGHPTFRSELLLRAEEIRAELGCSGPPDPHEGDGPYRKVPENTKEKRRCSLCVCFFGLVQVREEADRVLNMMYDEQYARREAPRAQQSMEGGQDSVPLPMPSFLPSALPSSASSSSSSVSSASGKRYEGMGNWTPPAQPDTWVNKTLDAVTGATTAVLEKTGLKAKAAVDYNDPELYTRQSAMGGGGGSYSGPSSHGGDAGIRGLSTQQANLFEKKKKKTRRKPGEAGGTWQHGDEEEEDDDDDAKPQQQQQQNAAPRPAAFDYKALTRENGQQQQQQKQGGATEEEEEEEEGIAVGPDAGAELPRVALHESDTPEHRLAESLSRGGGVREKPSDAELADFAARAANLAARPLAKVSDAVFFLPLL